MSQTDCINSVSDVGKSLEIIPVGTTYLRIGDTTYSWCAFYCLLSLALLMLKFNVYINRQKPSSFMRNLIAGEKYLEHCGFMTIHTTSSSSPDVLHRERPVCLVRGSIFIEDYIEGTVRIPLVRMLLIVVTFIIFSFLLLLLFFSLLRSF